MGRVARAVACGAALSVVACGVILKDDFGEDPPGADDGDASSEGRETGASGDADNPTDAGTDGNTGSDPDSSAPADACSLASNGAACKDASACCSGSCGAKSVCVSSCTGAGNLCFSDDCCVGLWCNGQCTKCIDKDNPAAAPVGVPIPYSCCSRELKDLTNCK